MPAGGEDVRDHDVVEFFFHRVLAQTQTVEVPVRHAQVLGLSALIRPHVREPVRRSRELRFGLHGQAVVGEATFAVFAETAGDVERQHHTVAHFYLAHRRAGLDHLAQVFVPEGAAWFEAGTAFVHVQVRPANVRRRDPHQHVGRVLNFGVGDLLDTNVVRSFVNYCLHLSALFFLARPDRGQAVVASGTWAQKIAGPVSGTAARTSPEYAY